MSVVLEDSASRGANWGSRLNALFGYLLLAAIVFVCGSEVARSILLAPGATVVVNGVVTDRWSQMGKHGMVYYVSYVYTPPRPGDRTNPLMAGIRLVDNVCHVHKDGSIYRTLKVGESDFDQLPAEDAVHVRYSRAYPWLAKLDEVSSSWISKLEHFVGCYVLGWVCMLPLLTLLWDGLATLALRLQARGQASSVVPWQPVHPLVVYGRISWAWWAVVLIGLVGAVYVWPLM